MYSVTTQHDFFVSVADQEQQHDQQSRFSDPAIMSASFGMPLASPQDAFGHTQQAFRPPPGLVYPAGLPNNVVSDGKRYFLLFPRRRPT